MNTRPLLRLALGGALLVGGVAPRTSRVARADQTPDSARLAYQFQTGDSRRYSITALFNGHFPPFAQPKSPPIHLLAQLVYIATVKKQTAQGAEVEFNVDSADISLLEKDPGPDAKIDPDSETPFPLPLSQVQDALNVKATLRPDGSVASVEGGSNAPVKVDLGIDLRKLFLFIMPVMFPNHPVKVNDAWTFDDGVLGHKPGKTTYKAHLESITPEGSDLAFQIIQAAQSNVSDKMDKDGKSATKPADVVGSLKGKVNLTGTTKFIMPPATNAADTVRAGWLEEGKMNMTALLTRVGPDPELPDKTVTNNIDVNAHLTIHLEKGAAGTPNAGAAAPDTQKDSH